jgi:hypothetical protein
MKQCQSPTCAETACMVEPKKHMISVSTNDLADYV